MKSAVPYTKMLTPISQSNAQFESLRWYQNISTFKAFQPSFSEMV